MESIKTASNNTEENKTASDQRKETLSVVDNRNGKPLENSYYIPQHRQEILNSNQTQYY